MSFEHAAIQFQHQPAPHNPYEELQRELAHTEATIAYIDGNMEAPDFYQGDVRDVTESRQFFEERRDALMQKLSSRSLIAAEVTL